MSRLKIRFAAAMAAYAVFALLAWATLDGKIRLAVWIVMAGLALRTWLATVRGE